MKHANKKMLLATLLQLMLLSTATLVSVNLFLALGGGNAQMIIWWIADVMMILIPIVTLIVGKEDMSKVAVPFVLFLFPAIVSLYMLFDNGWMNFPAEGEAVPAIWDAVDGYIIVVYTFFAASCLSLCGSKMCKSKK